MVFLHIFATLIKTKNNMELYHITSKKQGETYVIKNWCTEIDKQGRLSYFVYGKGYRKTKCFELVDVELPLKKDGLYIGEIFAKYGADVASRICEESFGCCKMSADSWVYGFGLAYNVAKEHFAEKMGEIPTEITNNIRCFLNADQSKNLSLSTKSIPIPTIMDFLPFVKSFMRILVIFDRFVQAKNA